MSNMYLRAAEDVGERPATTFVKEFLRWAGT